ncbi:hypothetical protein [Umezawaea tangerina]|uniref:hypothetical protein n=1 Tax=Umezawaea tangerina TaxID=84725 RepID=UPI0011B24B3B|nr:hypothetical protein [Umezawaea tangerina]
MVDPIDQVRWLGKWAGEIVIPARDQVSTQFRDVLSYMADNGPGSLTFALAQAIVVVNRHAALIEATGRSYRADQESVRDTLRREEGR